jgi:hypothetical protein
MLGISQRLTRPASGEGAEQESSLDDTVPRLMALREGKRKPVHPILQASISCH